jgi:hypothetical protein
MTNPTYQVNISYYPARATGRKSVNISGVTYSTLSYSDGYFIASMPEIQISATGTGYVDALNNLLLIATASSTNTNGQNPLSSIRTW